MDARIKPAHDGCRSAAFAGYDTPCLFCSPRSGINTWGITNQPIRHPVRILGIDPGLRRTGWGVIEIDGNRLVFIGCGSVEPPEGAPLARRLLAIHEGLG